MRQRGRTSSRTWLSVGLLLSLLALMPSRAVAEEVPPESVHTVRVMTRFMDPRMRQPQIVRELFKAHPEMRVKPFEGIQITNQGRGPGLAMAMAANDGPDIFTGDVRQSVSQGLAYPLTEWIGQDGVLANGEPNLNADGEVMLNGRIDADEAKWEGWMEMPPVYRQVCTVDGIPYALPRSRATYVGILYSRSMLLEAGLDPIHPPRSHDEFILWARKLYDHDRDLPALILMSGPWAFAPWVATTGSSIIVQDRTSPTTGKVYTFNEQEVDLIAPDTGEDLTGAPVVWRCNVASRGGVAAMELYHRLRWEPWIADPETGDPIGLTREQAAGGEVTVDGRTITFSQDDVIEGCIVPAIQGMHDLLKRLGRDYAMYPLYGNDLTTFENLGIDPSDFGMMAFPGETPEDPPVLQGSVEYAMLGKDIPGRGGDTPDEQKAYRDFVWELLWRGGSNAAGDDMIRDKVAAGRARFLNPRDLRRLGFEEYIKQVPPAYLKLWNDLDAGLVKEVHEPFMGRWGTFGGFYQREAIDIVLRPSGKDFDYEEALVNLERDANSGIMFSMPQEKLDKWRPLARVIVTIIGGMILFLLTLIVRSQLKKSTSRTGVHSRLVPWLMLIPAIGTIALWSYYPLLLGLKMAFEDYQVGGDSKFVGLDNFIMVCLDPNFYHYLWTTGKFVVWSLLLSFFTPILLAIFLSEVPRLKVFFRTLFFLPQMTSGLVVTLMWKEMFIGTSTGTINRVMLFLFGWAGFEPVDWLGNPSTVMACVIIPGVWASAGAASLIYLAALKSIPDELYEAASMDGAGVFNKARNITIPTIMPLVLINFVGTFIATFQGMGSIFLLTFGGPGKETMVLAMAIWQEAYVNLRFSIATTYAWILGAILISFTYLQMRILRRVDFRRAGGSD